MTFVAADQRFLSSCGEIAHGVVGDGPDVILVHGTPTSSLIWEPVVARIHDRFRFHFLDLPGFGRSAKYDGQEVRLRSFARVVSEWIESKGLGTDPVLVGHDFGAAAVLGAHLVEGTAVTAICVVDGVVLSPWGTQFSRHVEKHETVFAAVPGYVHEATLRAHLATAFSRPPDPEIVDALVAPWLGEEGQRAYYRQVGQFDHSYTDQLEELYPHLDIPTLILWGEEDPWVDIGVGRRLLSLVPRGQMKPLPHAGHFPMLETPSRLTGHLASWLIGVTGVG